MTHPESEQLWLYAAAGLDETESAAIETHLRSGCEACAAAVSEAHSDAGALALSASSREPGEAVRARLMTQVTGQAPAGDVVELARWRVPPALAAGLVGVGFVLGALGITATQAPSLEGELAEARGERDRVVAERDALAVVLADRESALASRSETSREALERVDALTAELAARSHELDALEVRVAGLRSERDRFRGETNTLASELLLAHDDLAAARTEHTSLQHSIDATTGAIALLESPGVEWVNLSGEDGGEAHARFFWEWEQERCLIDGRGLPETADGEVYALWIRYEEGAPHLVATFAPDRRGGARLLAPLTPGRGEVRAVRVTLEGTPEPGTPQGDTLLAGTLF